jgi:dTDP-4-dehydrorhamnose 3,5-epimerase
MLFRPLRLEGAFLIEPERREDGRGFFARIYCHDEFAAHGLETSFVHRSISFNARRLTLRGMHYQASPAEEAKVVRCTAGAILDVIVDIRKESHTWLQWEAAELSATNRRMVYVPRGFAHGFLTLADDTEVEYGISTRHDADAARGFRWNDPLVSIQWPHDPVVISDRDRTYEDFAAR